MMSGLIESYLSALPERSIKKDITHEQAIKSILGGGRVSFTESKETKVEEKKYTLEEAEEILMPKFLERAEVAFEKAKEDWIQIGEEILEEARQDWEMDKE